MNIAMIILTVLLFGLNVADYIVSIKGIDSGVAKEANPIAAWFFSWLPPSLRWVPKAVAFSVMVAIVWYAFLTGNEISQYASVATLSVVSGILGYVVWNNWKIVNG